MQVKDGFDPTPAEQDRLDSILSDHVAEYCQCGHKTGWGDITWYTETTEPGADYTVIEIQCAVCGEEIVQLVTWACSIDRVEYLLNEVERNWSID